MAMFVLSAEAEIDIAGISEYIAKRNVAAAIKMLDRQRYHGPSAATIQKHELADFEAHCPCLNSDVSIITKYMLPGTDISLGYSSRTSNSSAVLRMASGRHFGDSGLGGTTISILP